jgi:DNA-binding NarL/FixJ family response regulator
MTILVSSDDEISASSGSVEGFPERGWQPAAIRVLIIDDHPITRWGLARIADEQADMESVGECGSVAEAIELAEALRPDVVTIDILLSDGDGLDLARELRDRYQELGIVILTSQGEDDVLFRALDTGVSAFVSKSASANEILGAIRHSAVAASSFSAAGLVQALRRRGDVPKGPLLSPREGQVLRLLQEGRSVPEVATELFVSLSTAKTYVARLYEKLGATNRAQALMAAVRLDLIHAPRVVTGVPRSRAR